MSFALTSALRHRAVEMGLPIDSAGFVPVAQLLAHPQFRQYTRDDLGEAVRTCNKRRFALRKDAEGVEHVRANQGHSIKSVRSDHAMEQVRSPADLGPALVHGTTRTAWSLIESTGGLNRMARNHIHMAMGLPGAEGVISGMRNRSEVHVYLDGPSMLRDGVRLFRSENDVILCEGDERGFVLLKYVLYAKDAHGNRLFPPTREAGRVSAAPAPAPTPVPAPTSTATTAVTQQRTQHQQQQHRQHEGRSAAAAGTTAAAAAVAPATAAVATAAVATAAAAAAAAGGEPPACEAGQMASPSCSSVDITTTTTTANNNDNNNLVRKRCRNDGEPAAGVAAAAADAVDAADTDIADTAVAAVATGRDGGPNQGGAAAAMHATGGTTTRADIVEEGPLTAGAPPGEVHPSSSDPSSEMAKASGMSAGVAGMAAGVVTGGAEGQEPAESKKRRRKQAEGKDDAGKGQQPPD